MAFWKKWGWLMCGCMDMFDSMNYWREKRGEKKLEMRAVVQAMRESRPKALSSLDM
jgi:hypothetical protein